MITEWTLYQLHRHQRKLDAAYRYSPRPPTRDTRRRLARSAEAEAAIQLQLRGHHVTHTTHATRYDLLVDLQTRIEVKASTWHARYQIHYHNSADYLLWLCTGPNPQWFVIPCADLGDRTNLAIWTQDATHYHGQWAPYRNAWHLLPPPKGDS